MINQDFYNQSILVVEDDFINIFLIKNILAEFPNTHFAKNGVEFKKEMANNEFKTIFMDIELGLENENGIDLLQWFRGQKNSQNTKVYAITGISEQLNKQNYLDHGFNGLFIKPLDKNEILDTVHSGFDRALA